LHLAGLVNPEGLLQLTLPSVWGAAAPGAECCGKLLAERLTLTTLQLHAAAGRP